MPAHAASPPGAPCWVDLQTSDPARSRAFYSELLGWTAEDPSEEFGGYFMFTKGGVPVAGGMTNEPGSGRPDAWSVYLATEDAGRTMESVASHGGEVQVQPMPVADLGVMAFASDPAGAAVGVWQPASFPGFGLLSEPGAPSWFELHTRDYAAALSFYRDVFGWQIHAVSDTADFRYSTLAHGEEWLAGVMDAAGTLPAGSPSAWMVYFGTQDTDAALEAVARLGGSVVTPAADSPYGRIATATDPTGAQFKLVAANEARPAGQ